MHWERYFILVFLIRTGLLEFACHAVFKKNFKVIDDVQIFPFVEDRLTYEIGT